MTMTSEEIEELAVAIAKALQQARSVSDSEHYDHHKWITERITHEKMRQKFWGEMQRHIAKWGAISLLSFGFYALWLGLRQVLKISL